MTIDPSELLDTELARGMIALDQRCDGARSDDGIGFMGGHAQAGKAIASRIRSELPLSVRQFEFCVNALPHYFNTQLTWIDQGEFTTEVESMRASFGAAQKHRDNVATERAYDDAFPLLKKIPLEGVDPKDREFLSSLQKWRGRHTERQQPHVSRIVARYEYLIPRTVEETASVERVNSTPVLSQAGKGNSLRDLIAASKTKDTENAVTPQVDTVQREEHSPRSEETAVVLAPDTPEKPLTYAEQRKARKAAVAKAIISGGTPEQHLDVLQGTLATQDEPERIEDAIPIQLPPVPVPAGHVTEDMLDASQLAALEGMMPEQFTCLTGAAGTGKTTITKLLVDRLARQQLSIDINNYTKAAREAEVAPDKHLIPAMAFCAYTGRAAQQIKRNMPEQYHASIMTIHKLLGFYPEMFEEINEETQEMASKRRFVPYYTADNKLPWRVIVIDEAGMVPLPLWQQLWDACRPETRIIMIGDINQLPPVHGRSVFGFALTQWPSFELNKIHRQKGEENPIVENAWRILNGSIPVQSPGFQMIHVPGTGSHDAAKKLRGVVMALTKQKFFTADTDAIIVPQNGKDPEKAGYVLGQLPLNDKFCTFFNPPPENVNSEQVSGRRVQIQCGIGRKAFAVGDKIMVTVNDNERNLTNGMVGKIIGINVNGDAGFKLMDDDSGMTLEEMFADFKLDLDDTDPSDAEAEDYNKRASSHVVEVDFGETYDGNQVIEAFSTVGQVASLTLAYAFTCHKSQGGEYPTVVICAHSSNHRNLYREWLYTAATRAQFRVILVYNDKGLMQCLNRQKIKGANLQEKAQKFIEWDASPLDKSPELPAPNRYEIEGR